MKFKKLLESHKVKKSKLKIYDQNENPQPRRKTKTKSSLFKKNRNDTTGSNIYQQNEGNSYLVI